VPLLGAKLMLIFHIGRRKAAVHQCPFMADPGLIAFTNSHVRYVLYSCH
jgi:hypothetical protein